MWGGWYADSEFMQMFTKLYKICSDGMERKHSQVAVFTDENCYFGLRGHRNKIWDVCNSIGLSGVMYDIFLASDFDKVYNDYKVCVFVEPTKTELMTACIRKAEERKKAVRVITDSDDVTAGLFREFFKSVGLDVPIDRNAVVYETENYIVFYAHEKGEYDFSSNGRKVFTDLFTDEEITFPYTVTKTTCRLFRK